LYLKYFIEIFSMCTLPEPHVDGKSKFNAKSRNSNCQDAGRSTEDAGGGVGWDIV